MQFAYGLKAMIPMTQNVLFLKAWRSQLCVVAREAVVVCLSLPLLLLCMQRLNHTTGELEAGIGAFPFGCGRPARTAAKAPVTAAEGR